MLSSAVAMVLRERSTGLRLLTLGAGVVTDVQRLARVTPSDGLARPGGFGVYPASSAAVVDSTLNGDFETNTTGWANQAAGGVISRITTDSLLGSACLQTVNDGTGANQGPITSTLTGLTALNTYTFHLWIRSVSGATTVRVSIDWYTAGVVFISSSTADITITAAWQHFMLSAAAPALGVDAKLMVINTAATAATYNIDAVQFDNGGPSRPFDAANTRAAGRVQFPVAGLFTATQGWVAYGVFCANAHAVADNTGSMQNSIMFDWRDDASNLVNVAINDDQPDCRLNRGSAGLFGTAPINAQGFTFAAGSSFVQVGYWTAAGGSLDMNGAAFITASDTNVPTLAATLADLLTNQANARYFGGNLLWAVTGKGTPTAADAAVANTWGKNPPTLDQIAMLSVGSKPTALLPCKDATMLLLPAFYGP